MRHRGPPVGGPGPPASEHARAFARVLRAYREKRGTSQERLAHAAGLHRTYVGLIERGARNPTLDAAHVLARALGLRLSELVREAERAVG